MNEMTRILQDLDVLGALGQWLLWPFRRYGTDMNDPNSRSSSKLAGHIWGLKDKGVEFDISWRILAKAPPFNPVTKKCQLCLKEKHFIMYGRGTSTLNKRQEIFNTCRHRLRDLLVKVK